MNILDKVLDNLIPIEDLFDKGNMQMMLEELVVIDQLKQKLGANHEYFKHLHDLQQPSHVTSLDGYRR